MRTIDQQLTTKTTFLSNLRRDLKLLLQIAAMLISYFITGSRIRRSYRTKEAKGEVFWVDEEFEN